MSRAQDLRRAFDEAFSQPVVTAPERSAHLAFSAGELDLALPLLAVEAVLVDRKVVSVPGASPGCLGLIGLRGNLLPVYDLAALVGRARPQAPPRWILVAAGEARVGLAVDRFRGLIEVPEADLTDAPEGAEPFVARLARVDGHWRAVLAPAPLFATLRGAAAKLRSPS